MSIKNTADIADPARDGEPSNRERRIKAGYRRLLRAVLDGKRGTERLKAKGERLKEGRKAQSQPRAAVEHLARFLCVALVLTLLATGCAGPRPLRGGKAVVTRTPGGAVQHTLTQSENPAQATKQEQESVKVRTFVVPAGSTWEGERPREPKLLRGTGEITAREDARPPSRQPSTLNSHPSSR
jgi:hypothetical protein